MRETRVVLFPVSEMYVMNLSKVLRDSGIFSENN